MILVDSSAWIEFLVGSELEHRLAQEFPARHEWLVPTMVQLELAKWLTRVGGETSADQVLAFTETCIVAELDTRIALKAAQFCIEYRLSTADAIIYATARANGASLLTCDSHFGSLPDVAYRPKRGQ